MAKNGRQASRVLRQSSLSLTLEQGNDREVTHASSYQPKCSPFIKWAGGKTQLIKRMYAYFPRTFNRYYEPFVGGGSVFFHLAYKKYLLRATISDLNGDLINAYGVIRDDVGNLIERLTTLQSEFRGVPNNRTAKNKFYLGMRSSPPDMKKSLVERAAWFIFLNKTAFNGLYRVNSKGIFNVPYGDYPNASLFEESNLRNIHALLNREGIEVIKSDYASVILKRASRDDFVYLDPPYYTEDNRGFTNYNSSVFAKRDQLKLAKVVKTLTEKGCKVAVSNADVPFIRELFEKNGPSQDSYSYKHLTALRSINCKGSLRSGAHELLIWNY